MKVGNCMTRNVQVANLEQSIREVAQIMGRLDAGVMPVGDHDRLVGMITDRDIAIRGVALGKGPDTKVRDVMSPEVKYCFDDEDVEQVLENMGDLQVRRLPVLNRDKRLVGIISLSDLATNGEAAEAGEALSDISKPGGKHSQTLTEAETC
jgi:CBS domain-containing protein